MAVTRAEAPVRSWGAGTAAIARLLIGSDQPMTGVAIATAVGVTQPRASQVLKQFANRDAVRSTDAGYVGNRRRLFDLYRTRARPVLVQPETYWYSTRTAADQVNRVVDKAARDRTAIAASADFAPDLLVPWRHPTLTIVYVTKRVSLTESGFVRADGRADASLILRWTSDRSLVAPPRHLWPTEVGGVPLTDPVQQWWDLLDLGGQDRVEGADRLRKAILDHKLPTSS